ncbi:MAG: ATP-binding protein [Verrucomicrobiota bacterium]
MPANCGRACWIISAWGAALQCEARQFQERSQIGCQISVPSDTFSLEPERSTGVFPVFQELLTNVVRHAQATRVTVVLSRTDEKVTLELHDNGRGIRAEDLSNPRALGLLGMHERAALMGGGSACAASPGLARPRR